jgi:hypothetical protein
LTKRPSKRLANILIGNLNYSEKKPFKYVEDVEYYAFTCLRGAGRKTWEEFCSLRGIPADI